MLKKITYTLLAAIVFLGCGAQGEENPTLGPEDLKTKDQIVRLLELECQSPVPFSGSLLVEHNGKILVDQSFASERLPFQATAWKQPKYFLASITKHFTAVAVLQLYQQGKIKLDDPLSAYQFQFPWADSVTVRHLLTHRSGVIRDIVEVYDAPMALDSLMDKISKTELLFSPGSEFRYANPNYLILSKLIERISGQSYFEYIKAQLLQPFQLTNTGQRFNLEPIEGLVTGQSIGVDTTQDLTTTVASMAFLSSTRYGAGALYSNSQDLQNYLTRYQAGEVLPDTLRALMEQPTSENYGMGWFVDSSATVGKKVWHTGRTYGYRTGMYLYPDKNLKIILLCNYDLSDRNRVIQQIEQIIFDQPVTLPKVKPILSGDLKQMHPFLGLYLLGGDTPMEVFQEDNHFYVQSHGDPKEIIYMDSDTSFFSQLRDMQFHFSPVRNSQSDTLFWTYRGTTYTCPRR